MKLLLDEPKSYKAKVHCYYLNQEGYVKFYKEYWGKKIVGATKEKALKSWKRLHKEVIDEVEYRKFVDYPGFSLKSECEIAKKYGYETIEEIEWINL